MSFESLLISTCTVRRYAAGGAADSYGTPARVWADHLPEEPCRLMASAGKEVMVGAEVVIANYKLFLGNVDVTEQDRVIIGLKTYEVLLVSIKQDGAHEDAGNYHKELLMRIVR